MHNGGRYGGGTPDLKLKRILYETMMKLENNNLTLKSAILECQKELINNGYINQAKW